MYKVVVAGSRGFNDYPLLEKTLIHFLCGKRPSEVEIVSGGARGADKLGERFAKEKGCSLTIMNADWDTYGKSAGYRRNADMAKYTDAAIIFWDGVSRGSKHMIDLAKQQQCELLVVRYDEEGINEGN
jgi:hypothetical protein